MEDEDQLTEEASASSDESMTDEVETDAVGGIGGADVRIPVNGRKRRPMVLIAAAVAVVLAVSLIAIGVSGPGSKGAAAEVILGARTTLAKNSVDLTLSGTMSADGQTIPIGGSGFADRATGLESLTITFSDENIPIQETALTDQSGAYMQIVENNQNQITRYLPGKQWVQIPGASQSTELNATTPNVLDQLQVLTQEGNTVVSLGDSTINGETVVGYQVTITQKAMTAAIKRVEAQGGATAQALEASLKVISLNPPVVKLWLSSDHLLVREEALISVSSGGATASGDIFINFSNYGGSSTISAPATGTVASFKEFLTAAQAPGLH
ncbi:MAG: hypothetical protein ABSA22_05465 [Acidimicrobiales bacterium]